MGRFRIGLLGLLGLCLVGCSQAQMEASTYPSMADVKYLDGVQSERFRELATDMTGQHTEQDPDKAEAIAAINAASMARMEQLAAKVDAYEGTIGQMVQRWQTVAGDLLGIEGAFELFEEGKFTRLEDKTERQDVALADAEKRTIDVAALVEKMAGEWGEADQVASKEHHDLVTRVANLAGKPAPKEGATNLELWTIFGGILTGVGGSTVLNDRMAKGRVDKQEAKMQPSTIGLNDTKTTAPRSDA